MTDPIPTPRAEVAHNAGDTAAGPGPVQEQTEGEWTEGELTDHGWTAGWSIAAAPAAPDASDFTAAAVGPAMAARPDTDSRGTAGTRSTSGELLVHAARQAPAPATSGWRGRVHRYSGGVLRPGPGPAELRARAELDCLRQTYDRPRTVVVANPKGGAGKTPTTLLLAAMLGTHRGGYVMAWDNNETRGTLGLRAGGGTGRGTTTLPGQPAAGVRARTGTPSTVWDLLSALDRFEGHGASVGELAGFIRPQEARFDVLASDEDADRMGQIGAGEFARIHDVLARFYRLVLVDTGNNLRAPNWQAAIAAADVLVVVSTYEWDTAYSASWMLDHLCGAGREDLVAGAVTVLTAADPRPDKRTREQLLRHFSRTAAVVEIPYDTALRGGGQIHPSALRPASSKAWISAAAAVCTRLEAAGRGDQHGSGGRGAATTAPGTRLVGSAR